MALKVIGAGFGRTGTLSTYSALNQLGLRCYHGLEMIANEANRSHLDFWLRVANTPAGTKHDWNEVFAKYAAAVDNPACCVWRELLEAYPDAKVLLTLHPRGPAAWFESTIDTIYFTENLWQFQVLRWVTPWGRKLGDLFRKLIWERNLKGTMPDRDRAIARYEQHIEEVKAAVPAERLLVFSVDQGWEPLCKFLGLPVPGRPFPNINDRAQIKKLIAVLTRRAYVILAATLVLALMALAAFLLARSRT
jgi:hypothetical protein